MRCCPGFGAAAEKLVHSWPKNTVCARKPEHKPRFLATGGQKMRWCPEIGAGTKKLSTAGQKSPFVPRNRAQTPISGQGWTKIALVPRNWGRSRKTCPQLAKKARLCPQT
ncbi:MAG: hypothetical protein QM296_04385 [Bacillota bacterium]|nr:hypothetical protein [Bacillota bacterium]